jgi:type II secretory pathway pseudopilin PulG
LIELLVSLALFSIFLVAVMGAIFTIIDTNKKARSLMTVMNNLSFAVDGMVRSFKTGVNPRLIGNDCFTTNRLDYGHNDFDIDDIQRESATFCFREVEGQGKITLSIGSFQTDYTSPDIDIDYMRFDLDGENADGRQPRLLINIEGTAKISEKISSNFAIQTTVSQSKIDS